MLPYKHSILSDGAGGLLIGYPFVLQDDLEALATRFHVQPSDVFLVSYPKSGTNWVRQIVHLLTNGGAQGQRGIHEAIPLLERETHDGRLAPQEERRCYISHLPHRLMPGAREGRARYLYVARNPKDCAVSYFHFLSNRGDMQYQGGWDGFVGLFERGLLPYGEWSAHVLAWWRASQQTDRILFLTYEDLYRDLGAAVERIAGFLDIPLTPALCASVVEQSRFEAMAANAQINTAPPKDGYSNRTLRKGQVGDWRNHFSPEQRARFDTRYQQLLADAGLSFSDVPDDEAEQDTYEQALQQFAAQAAAQPVFQQLGASAADQSAAPDGDAELDAYEQALQQFAAQASAHSAFQQFSAAAASAVSEPVPAPGPQAARQSTLPPVSCICLTYARPELLEEAIESFLRQDYRGPKELIVLNDYAAQTLVFAHPEVRVINLPRRFRTVGEKMNAAVALASHDLLFVWDDDDIFLPHRLSFSVERFDPRKGFFKADRAWFWNDAALSGPVKNLFHVGSCWSRRLFDAVRGYPAEGNGSDLLFEQRLARQFPGSVRPDAIAPEEIYYLYRWGGTGSYHLSAFGELRIGANVGMREVEAFVQQRAARGEIRRGVIPLEPGWKTDYQELVSRHLATQAEPQAPLR
jgi:hypothetical protein